jgi:cell wall assembly regulator SMI1
MNIGPRSRSSSRRPRQEVHHERAYGATALTTSSIRHGLILTVGKFGCGACAHDYAPLPMEIASRKALLGEHKCGITLALVHDILRTVMPALFPQAGERQPIRDTWTRIERWLAEAAPEILGSLQPGATDEQISDTEAALAVTFPEVVCASYRIQDGQPPDGLGLMDAWEFLSLSRILDEWRIWKDLLDDGEYSHARSEPEEGIAELMDAGEASIVCSHCYTNFVSVRIRGGPAWRPTPTSAGRGPIGRTDVGASYRPALSLAAGPPRVGDPEISHEPAARLTLRRGVL